MGILLTRLAHTKQFEESGSGSGSGSESEEVCELSSSQEIQI